jgi:hypothetical protein
VRRGVWKGACGLELGLNRRGLHGYRECEKGDKSWTHRDEQSYLGDCFVKEEERSRC